VKKEALKELEVVVQKTKKSPSVAIVEFVPMEETTTGKGV
jgi:hypothetical protein